MVDAEKRKEMLEDELEARLKAKEYPQALETLQELVFLVCKHSATAVEDKKVLSISHEGEVEVLFEEVCEQCGKVIGTEIQVFKYYDTKRT